jgi:preprotein translocase subunit Sss1
MADWYYTANGQQAGPVDLGTLRGLFVARTLSETDLVFGPGFTQWAPAGQVTALHENAATAQVAVQAAPSTLGYRGVETDASGLSAVAMNALRATKPWVRFISIMTFIGAGFMVLGGIGMIFAGVMAGAGKGAMFPGWLGGAYLALAAIYLIPALLLNRYANGIASLMRTQRMSDVEVALGAQRSFWKFTGILVIVVLCLYVLGIVGFVIFKMRF